MPSGDDRAWPSRSDERIAFPQLNKTELRIGPGNYALGLSTNEDVRFQGFHGRRRQRP
jgi:hypothetical protein